MDNPKILSPAEIEDILGKIEAHALKAAYDKDGLKIGLLHTVHNSRITFAQSYINSLKGQTLTPEQKSRLDNLKIKLYIPPD
jgi:hypothetical protein